jgi:uncharacterized protein (UPF0548 family)
MARMSVHIGRLSTDALERLLVAASASKLTYPEIGATGDATLPAGYRHTRVSVPLGSRTPTFEAASEALRSWAAHRHIGAVVVPDGAPLQEGVVVVVAIRRGPLSVVAPCRIVSVVNDRNQFGFAYGTLSGHPESGEESFMIRRVAGEVSIDLVAFSRPNDLLVRLASPIARRIQARATSGYLEGVRQFVEMHI